jgi:hypothetical protein
MTTTRRLAAILAADMVSYSRLMGTDEEGTLARLQALRSEVIDPAVAKSGGRIVKSTGDGILADFPSAVEAVRCPLEMQGQTCKREEARDPEYRIECASSTCRTARAWGARSRWQRASPLASMVNCIPSSAPVRSKKGQARMTSVNTKPSRSTVSPIWTGMGAENIGPAVTTV